MREFEFRGMQEVAVQCELLWFRLGLFAMPDHWNLRRRAIEGVAHDRMADRREMHANLMRAAGLNADGKKGELAEIGVDALKNVVMGHCRPGTGFPLGRHPRAPNEVTADRCSNSSVVVLNSAMYQRDVSFANLPARKHLAELEVGDV